MNKKTPYWGNCLRELMDRKDLKPADLAKLADVSEASVYLWLSTPQKSLPAGKAARLQAIFSVPYYKIFPLIEDNEAAQ